eukprot:TRINITY_DN4296_c0_g1_i4.p1 TRINITY_DN4296_c0_g1~~TRINITY_DN4296_c0_g1_i4.p1  ORF type:complete len:555 (+),score=232.01 TRINITY_DN4296_c0_g1_i4:504-2168(+)
MYISLPLPEVNATMIKVRYVKLDGSQPTAYAMEVSRYARAQTLKDEMVALNPEADSRRILMTSNVEGYVRREFSAYETCSRIDTDRDIVVMYETQPAPEKQIHNVYIRKLKPLNTYSDKMVFKPVGMPLMGSFLKRGETYRTLYNKLLGYISWCINYDAEIIEDAQDSESSETGNGGEEGPGGEVKQESSEQTDDESSSGNTGKERINFSMEEGNEGVPLFTINYLNHNGSQHQTTLNHDDWEQDIPFTNQFVGIDIVPKYSNFYDEEMAMSTQNHESVVKLEAEEEDSGPVSVNKCLTTFLKEEQLAETDPWYCNKCGDFRRAFKKFDLWKMPRLLVIHLKRFSYTEYSRDKLDTEVDFEINGLDLSEYITGPVDEDNPPIYDLYAVSNHYGNMGFGHYTAFARNKDDGAWYEYDDSRVTRVNDPENIKTSAAYVLFYERRSDAERDGTFLGEGVTRDFDKKTMGVKPKNKSTGAGASGGTEITMDSETIIISSNTTTTTTTSTTSDAVDAMDVDAHPNPAELIGDITNSSQDAEQDGEQGGGEQKVEKENIV